MKTNEFRKDSEKRSIYKSQMYFHTLAINNPKNEIKKLSIYTQYQKEQLEIQLTKEVKKGRHTNPQNLPEGN